MRRTEKERKTGERRENGLYPQGRPHDQFANWFAMTVHFAARRFVRLSPAKQRERPPLRLEILCNEKACAACLSQRIMNRQK